MLANTTFVILQYVCRNKVLLYVSSSEQQMYTRCFNFDIELKHHLHLDKQLLISLQLNLITISICH
jgi:hypothetical protein